MDKKIGFSTRELYESGQSAAPFRARERHARRVGSFGSAVRHRMRAAYASMGKRRRSAKRVSWRTLAKWGVGSVGGIGVLSIAILWFTLPNINDPGALFAAQSTVISDRNGVELYRVFSEQDRTYVPLASISDHVKQATIAIEDERFLQRGCFDAIGFTRAVVSQFVPGFVRSGGSTLTQQFAGNALVGRQRSILRKARELMLACQLERRYDKDELLELYLNWIPYGHNAYGVEQASRRYFGISADEVSLAQASILAALPQRPSYFNPYGRNVRTSVPEEIIEHIHEGSVTRIADIPSGTIRIGLMGSVIGTGAHTLYIGGRTDQVLYNMEKLGMISAEERTEALADLHTMTFQPARDDIRAPHFVLWVREQAQQLLGVAGENVLEQGGFHITTTLDWELQQIGEETVKKYAENNANLYETHNAALVSIDPETREVLAYVGNMDYNDEEHEGKIDMVRVPRQPGSSFKPFVYALAFERGYGPASPTYDVQTRIGDDTPQNYDGSFLGLMTMRSALGHSRNIPAAKAFFLAGGEDRVLSFVESIGVTTPVAQKNRFQASNPAFDYGWPLAIGTAETPLIEMVQGYAAFADGGRHAPAVSILSITDRKGNIMYQARREPKREVLDPRIAAQVTSILSDNDARPPNEYWRSVLTIPGFEAAAKTGTSNKCLERNAQGVCTLRRPESTWTIGYTPQLVTGVWAGNATSQALSQRAESLVTASPIWKDFMMGAHRVLPTVRTSFSLPNGIINPQVSLLSGKLPAPCTPVELRKSDLFLQENMPTEEDSACIMLEIDRVTGLLASDVCPLHAVEERAFLLASSEAPERWPLWEQAVQEWVREQMELWDGTENHSGSLLPLPLAPTELCDPLLTPGRDEIPEVTILFPGTGDRVSYPAFEPRIVTRSLAGIREVRYEVDGRPVRTVTTPPFSIPIRVPRTISEDGTHTLRVIVVNEYFTETSTEATFRFGETLQPIVLPTQSEEQTESSANGEQE